MKSELHNNWNKNTSKLNSFWENTFLKKHPTMSDFSEFLLIANFKHSHIY